MGKIKKIHRIILLFILIFILGVYSFTLYINNTIDHKSDLKNETDLPSSKRFDTESIQVN